MINRFAARIPLLFFIALFFTGGTYAQNVQLVDARRSHDCTECITLLKTKPREVQFGIQIHADGDVYFALNNRAWFDKLFTSDVDGVAVDLVSKDLYACDKPLPGVNGFGKGQFLPPVYLPELKKNMLNLGSGHYAVRIGHVPASLKDKDLEGNLAILKRGVVCFYTYFTDIPRSTWDLLPMGLYADTLVSLQAGADSSSSTVRFYTKRLQFTIPFQKGKTQFNNADLKPLYDSLKLTKYSIRQIDIRAYSSIDGAEDVNAALQQKRAASMIKALQQFQSPEIDTHITSSENWIEFMNDIRSTPYKDLAGLSKPDIKLKLLDKTVLAQLEPMLKNHRKAIVTIYLAPKSGLEKTSGDSLVMGFHQALTERNIKRAGIIQEAIFERIADGKLPSAYIRRLEIPKSLDYGGLQNNQVTYQLLLKVINAREAMADLRDIAAYAPDNGQVRYNIAALSFTLWRYDSGFVKPAMFREYINNLSRYGIENSLVKRMLINYHIVMSQIFMARYDYAAKDEALAYIGANYNEMKLEDKDLLSLAKYLCYYARCDWAAQVLEPRVEQIDVNEDLLFYYINLEMFYPDKYKLPKVKNAVMNAISINPKRFCTFFNAVGKGGSSFQLLDLPHLRGLYCENCGK